jgi:hypothetical protein
MTNDITVVINAYKRPYSTYQQVQSIYNQKNVSVREMFYVQNTLPNVQYDSRLLSLPGVTSFIMSRNLGVWGRFYAALNARTNWVCILDDDTIPGNLWLQNCLETYKTHPGLLGTIGLRFANREYHIERRIGWDGPNENVEQVDIVGHSWFFHRDMLSLYCRELPPIDHNMIVGEDIHGSYMLQKYSEYKTYVPPHPINNKEMWGSLHGWTLGGDHNATAGNGGMPLMKEFMKRYTDSGFKMMYELKE